MGHILYTIQTHIYMYLYTLILKGFMPKHTVPFRKKNFNKHLIKYISIKTLLVLNKNKVLKYWKTFLNVCTDSFLSQIILGFGTGPTVTSVFLFV